jgi:hypothetical protein
LFHSAWVGLSLAGSGGRRGASCEKGTDDRLSRHRREAMMA